MNRQTIWVRFAAAALAGGTTPNRAATLADLTLKEFYRRWEWHDGGVGTSYWKERQPQDNKKETE